MKIGDRVKFIRENNSFIEMIKKDKMEKIEVRSWEDLEGYVICKDVVITDKKEQRRSYGGCVFKVNSLENCVKILNVLGGNFEYVEVEVIDTLERWEEFQKKICRFSYFYDRVFGEFIELRADDDDNRIEEVIRNNVSIKEIEQKYNVDLQILKG